MTEVFSKFVFMSIHGGILVLPVILLRFIFRKAPKWIHCLMWLLVGLRLVFPFTIESTFSLMPSEQSVSGTYFCENNPMGASVYLSEDRIFNLTRSFSSSSAVIGTYEIRCGKLVLKAEDDVVFHIDGNQWVEEKGVNFIFRIDGDQLIYEAGASSGGLQDGSVYYRRAE